MFRHLNIPFIIPFIIDTYKELSNCTEIRYCGHDIYIINRPTLTNSTLVVAVFPIIRTIRLLRIAMKRWKRQSLKSRCKTVIKNNNIDYQNEDIPLELKQYLQD